MATTLTDASNVLPDLDERAIKATRPGDVLWDAKVKGLHLRHLATKKTFYLFYRTKAGVQRRFALGAYGTISLAKAREVAKELLGEVAAGRDPQAQRAAARAEHTLSDLWDEFWKRHASKKKSAEEDKRLWQKNLAPLATRRLSHIDYPAVADLHARITEEKGPIAANRSLALLSTMLNFAVAPLQWTERNPAKGVAKNKETKRKRYMKGEEAAAIAKVLAEKAEAHPAGVAFLWLLILTGARKGEIARARWDQVHGTKIILTEHKTDQSGEARVIHLPPAAMAVLGTLPRTTGTITGIKSPTTLWNSVRKAAKCPDLRIHDLRHSFASAALSAGLTLAQIGELLGHADSATTKRYSHLVDEAAALAAGSAAEQIMASMTASQPAAQPETSPQNP